MPEWADPPLDVRLGIPGLDFCIAYVSGLTRGIMRRESLEDAVTAAIECMERGCQVRVYFKNGMPVE
ncbi:MAG TPA: hypothetical protein VFP46_01510 [Candidatus Paceibacterota bacterium]|nr:hypothetical protein [Candidatus Paceibacterota bacterium]